MSSAIGRDFYLKKAYEYQDSKTFIAWDKISPAVISDKEQFDALRVFQVRNLVNREGKSGGSCFWAINYVCSYSKLLVLYARYFLFMGTASFWIGNKWPIEFPNVVGLAPRSPFWEGVEKSLFLSKQRFTLQVCYFPEHESIKTHYLYKENKVMIPIPKTNARFSFDSSLKLFGQEKAFPGFKVCIGNAINSLFRTTKDVYNRLVGLLCKDVSVCQTEGDLRDFDPEANALSFETEGQMIFFQDGAEAKLGISKGAFSNLKERRRTLSTTFNSKICSVWTRTKGCTFTFITRPILQSKTVIWRFKTSFWKGIISTLFGITGMTLTSFSFRSIRFRVKTFTGRKCLWISSLCLWSWRRWC